MAGRIAGKASVDLRTFLTVVVKAAANGQNQTWVAGELGCSPAAVSLRLKSLRDKGVKVPELASTRSSNVAEDAMDILAELGIEQDAPENDTEIDTEL
jgi:predicted transcriptional regulator